MRRLDLLLLAAPVGLATGILAWVAAGGASANSDQLATAQRQIAGLKVASRSAPLEPYVAVESLVASPLFTMSVGPGAVPDPIIRLDGIVMTHQRVAALISVDGAPAEWVKAGDAVGGITLQQVQSSKIVVDTPFGSKEIALGERTGPPPNSPTPASSPPTAVASSDQPPAGMRLPPPPASAPHPPSAPRPR